MSAKRWIVALGAVLVIEAAVAFVLLLMTLEENCNNGISRWQCSESLEGLLVAILIALPGLYVTGLVVWAMRARQA